MGGDGAILFDYKEIISLYTSGMTMIEVSAKMQCSVDTVSKVININNMPRTNFIWEVASNLYQYLSMN